MKKSSLIFCSLILLTGCKKTEVANIVLQAEINDEFFRAIDARVTENEDGTFLIQGVTLRESLTMKVESLEEKIHTFGQMSVNYASFERSNGDNYFTNPYGEGSVTISNYDADAQIVSGTFGFTAMQEGADTIAVQNGIFYQAKILTPLDSAVIVDSETNAGTFICLVDENTYNPFNVSALESSGIIEIKGFTGNKSISIKVPLDTNSGSYPIPADGFSAYYQDGNGLQYADSGSLFVFSHDTVEKKIRGTFFFLTEMKSITLGQFNVTYQ